MQILARRYNRDLQRYNLALRMIAHEARTRTICEWTGLPDDRIRDLYQSYVQDKKRLLHRRRARIRVLPLDNDQAAGTGHVDSFNMRDRAMAEAIRGGVASLHQGEIPVIFVGNVHARKTKGLPFGNAPANADLAEPAGYQIRDLGLLHLNVFYEGGSAWICTRKCGIQSIGPVRSAAEMVSVTLTNDSSYDGLSTWAT